MDNQSGPEVVDFEIGISDASGKSIVDLTCLSCGEQTVDGDPFWLCLDCAPNTIFCENCGPSGHKSENHVVVKNSEHPIWQHLRVRGRNASRTIHNALKVYKERPCFGFVAGKEISFLSYGDVAHRSYECAGALKQIVKMVNRNVESLIPIFLEHGSSWYITEFAILLNGASPVGFHMTWDGQTLAAAIELVCPDLIFCSRETISRLRQAERILGRDRRIVAVIVGGSAEDVLDDDSYLLDAFLCSDSTVIGLHEESDVESVAPATGPVASGGPHAGSFQSMSEPGPNDIYTLFFTSGTSRGRLKAAVITHASWLVEADTALYDLPLVTVSFMPSSCGADRGLVWKFLLNGGRVVFSNPETLFADCRLAEPSLIMGPPVVFETLLREVASEVDDDVFPLGSRLRFLGVGGAPVGPGLLQGLRDLFPTARIVNSYGSTELSGIAEDGQIRADVSFKLRDCPQMACFLSDKPNPRGELLVKSNGQIEEYFRDSSSTEALLSEDGYICTGDVVEMLSEREIRIIDRVGNAIKLKSGLFVSPTALECEDSSYLVAIIRTRPDLANEEVGADAFLHEMRLFARHGGLPSHEYPHTCFLDESAEDWSIESGTLTSTFKPVRHKLRDRYAQYLSVEAVRARNSTEVTGTISGGIQGVDGEISVTEIVAQILGSRSVDTSCTFLENGGDSMSAVRLLDVLRLRFPSLSMDTVLTLPLARLDEGQPVVSVESVRKLLYEDMTQSLDFGVPSEHVQTDWVVLTGVTGFLGRYVCAELLQKTNLRVCCLVRGRDGVSRVQNSLNDVFQDFPVFAFDERAATTPGAAFGVGPARGCHVLCGDLSVPSFGLCSAVWDALVSIHPTVIHCASSVSFLEPYEARGMRQNVSMAREILRLVHSGGGDLHVVSTTSVVDVLKGDGGTPCVENKGHFVDENALSADLVASTDGYSLSKMVVERLCHRAVMEWNAFVKIYRVGMIGFDLETGKGNREDWLSRFLAYAISVSQFPALPGDLFRLLPVRSVAASIVSALGDRNRAGRCAEGETSTVEGTLFLWMDFLRAVDRACASLGEVRFVAAPEWARRMQSREQQRGTPDWFRPLIPFFQSGRPPVARASCSNGGKPSFPISQEAIERYVSWLIDAFNLPDPE